MATGSQRRSTAKTAPKTSEPADTVTEAPEPADTVTETDESTTTPEPVDAPAQTDTEDTTAVPDWDALLDAVEFEEPRVRSAEARSHITVDPRIQAMVVKSRDTKKKGTVPCTDRDVFYQWKRQFQAAGDRLEPPKSVNVRMIEDKATGALTHLQFRVTDRRGAARKTDRKSDAIDTPPKDAAQTGTE